MDITTIILFFIYTWCIGYSLTRWVQNSDNPLERNIMRIGFGLSAFVLLGVIFNLIRIPINWKWFLLASLIIPTYSLVKTIKNKQLSIPKIHITKTNLAITSATLISAFAFFMYATGAFSYPYLENDDPWGHAEGAKYVAVEKSIETSAISLDKRFTGVRFFGYLDPYPPGYDMLMGVLHQTAPSLSWTLKFFNALIISLGILFFFFFTKDFLGDNKKALFSTFALLLIPAYFTHFIWAHSLIVAVFFPTLYALQKINVDKRWYIVLAAVTAGMLLIQPSKIFKLVPMILIYLGIRWAIERKLPRYEFTGIILGAILSLAWWFEKGKAMLSIKYAARVDSTAAQVAQSTGLFDLILSTIRRLPEIFPPTGGSATRAYTFQDFFFAQPQGLINSSVGIGMVVYFLLFITTIVFLYTFIQHTRAKKSELNKPWLYTFYGLEAAAAAVTAILSLRYLTFFQIQSLLSIKIEAIQFMLLFILALLLHIKKVLPENTRWYPISLAWLTFTFLLVNSETFNLPIGLWAFRIWALFALAAAIIISEGLWLALDIVSKKFHSNAARVLIIGAVCMGIILTSGYQKYTINTAIWTPGGAWASMEEIQAYNWLKQNLPANTKVFPYSSRDQNIMGFDMFSCKWCPDVIEFRKKTLDYSAGELHSFLKQQEYEYLIVDAMSIKYLKKYFGYNETIIQEKLPLRIQEFADSGLFMPVHQTNGAIIFKVK